MTPAGEEAARFAADLIRIDTTNRGGGDGRERPAAEYVAARLAEAGLEPVLLESAPGRANVVARISGTGAGGTEPGAEARAGTQQGAQAGSTAAARSPGRGAGRPGGLVGAPLLGRDT